MRFTIPRSEAQSPLSNSSAADWAEQWIAARKKVTGRECGSCSLCCKLLDVPEAGKPNHEWCPHCRPGHGCRIYAQRPDICRGFACLWLCDSSLGGMWFPAKAKIVAHFHIDRKNGHSSLRFIVDPKNRWREEPYYSGIKEAARRSLRGDITTNKQS
jgi:hypothetical protein